MFGRLKARPPWRNERLDITLDIKEVGVSRSLSPLNPIHRAIGNPGNPRGLAKAFNRRICAFDRGVAEKDASDFKNPHTIRTTVDVEFDHLEQ